MLVDHHATPQEGKGFPSRPICNRRSRDGSANVSVGKNILADVLRDVITMVLAHGVKDMKMEGQSPHASGSSCNSTGRERVSFGTNMSSEEESKDNSMCQLAGLQMGLEMTKSRAYCGGTEKKLTLGIEGTTALKKQKTPVKTVVKDAV
jgi:hypothetical protein